MECPKCENVCICNSYQLMDSMTSQLNMASNQAGQELISDGLNHSPFIMFV